MRVLVDEDLASRELLRRLTAVEGSDVLAPDRSSSDQQVWERAATEGAAVLTGNAKDFLALAEQTPDHHGLLLVYRSNDRTTDLRATDIANGVGEIIRRFPTGVDGMTLVVNDFVRAVE